MNVYRWMVGHRTRVTYWSCTKFAGWVRKIFGVTKKPKAATSEEWGKWKRENDGKVGYWIAEEALDYIQDAFLFIPDVYHRIEIYIRNRYIDKPHYLDTKLKRGEWYEFDTRIIRGLFETLVDFVEIEKAHMQHLSEYWVEEEENKKRSWYQFGRGRKNKHTPSRDAGLKHLEWEIGLGEESPYQAATAKEIKELYLWWKDIRPNRPDPFVESGWSEYSEQEHKAGRGLFGPNVREKTEEERAHLTELSNKCAQLEEAYDAEDEEMLIRLIKIRKGCWT